MKTSNKLFVISSIYVPLMLLLMFYPQISDFYTYAAPLNGLVIGPNFPLTPEQFSEISHDKESKCFTTPNGNFYCYGKPRMFGSYPISTMVGSNGINGELHFNPIKTGVSYFTIKNMTQISGNDAMITFADMNYRVGNKDRITYQITDKFEFSAVIQKFDTFITHCNNYKGTSMTIVQYLGIETIDDIDYFLTWHMPAHSDNEIYCTYPQIIQYSLGHNFNEL